MESFFDETWFIFFFLVWIVHLPGNGYNQQVSLIADLMVNLMDNTLW